MQKSTFTAKAREQGDFQMYYVGQEGRVVFTVATADFTTPYIKNHRKMRNTPKFNPFTHTMVWSWSADRPIIVALSDVRKLVPLGSVLRNRVG